jgi:predicted ferric reductase
MLKKYELVKVELSNVFYLGLRKVILYYIITLMVFVALICLPVNIYYLILNIKGIKNGIDLFRYAPFSPIIFFIIHTMYSFTSLLTNKDLVSKQGVVLSEKNSFENGITIIYNSIYIIIPVIKFLYYYLRIKLSDV